MSRTCHKILRATNEVVRMELTSQLQSDTRIGVAVYATFRCQRLLADERPEEPAQLCSGDMVEMKDRDVILISHWTDTELPAGFSALARVAAEEGHTALERLHSEWIAGRRSFDHGSECLYVAYTGKCLAGVVGIEHDAASSNAAEGCLKLLYVDPVFRGQDLGSCLLNIAIKHATSGFDSIVLLAGTYDTKLERLSQRLGLQCVPSPRATDRYVFARA